MISERLFVDGFRQLGVVVRRAQQRIPSAAVGYWQPIPVRGDL